MYDFPFAVTLRVDCGSWGFWFQCSFVWCRCFGTEGPMAISKEQQVGKAQEVLMLVWSCTRRQNLELNPLPSRFEATLEANYIHAKDYFWLIMRLKGAKMEKYILWPPLLKYPQHKCFWIKRVVHILFKKEQLWWKFDLGRGKKISGWK